MIALVVHLVLCALDFEHCAKLTLTVHGPRCAAVELHPTCEQTAGWHVVLGAAVCTRDCAGEAPTR